jgi:GT2 family glycosyltransferase
VIVPVHGDLAATKACLESLLTQLDQAGRHQVIVVNDASPDRRIVRLLELLAASNHVRVLTNPRNLGFVGAVNRALREVSAGDVILLNADTIVPQGFIERLAAEACASPEIGTVTPLSNNGEFMSFPVPNRANIAGTAVEVAMIDRIAERTNAGLLVDVPNGIGFCLYITRDCLDAVGLLSESYQRGYLEDVDFCLRARRHGFRNVCAPSVYVGHAGSRSFKRKKRSLVVRNLRVVEQRFPAYRAECASFVLADPLKNARRAIELGMMASCSHSMLLVTPGGVAAEIARERARQRPSDDDCAALILQIGHEPGHIVATLRDVNGGVPQSLELRLPAGAPAELIEVLRRVPLRRMEIFAPDAIPPTIINALLDLSVAYDVFLSHAPDLSACHGVIAGAERILIPDAQAASVASALAHSGLTVLPQAAIGRHPPLRRVSKKAARPGLLPITRCTREHHFVRRLTATLAKERPDLDVVTIGSTPDDTELMRAGVFVTGSVEANELHALVRRYQLDRMIVCATQPLFGHPLLAAAMACAIPVAFFDWSGGRCRARDGDLALEPPVSAEFAAARLLPWLEEFKSA